MPLSRFTNARNTLLSVMLASSACAAVLIPVAAHATLLSDLFNGASISAAELDFNNWSLGSASGSPAPDPTQIDVTALLDDLNNPGLLFTANGQLTALPGNSPVRLNFAFDINSSGRSIVGNSLTISSLDVGGTYSASVTELVQAGGSLLGTLQAGDSNAGPALPISDSQGFAPQTTLQINKNILLEIEGSIGDLARINTFTQRFALQPSQVPAPGSLALVLLGVAGLLRLRKHSRA